MDVTNQVVVISGAASGMGAATARWLAKQNAKLALLDLNTPAVEAIAKEVNGLAFTCDITQEQEVEHALETIQSQLGTPRVCINCAGVLYGRRVIGKEGPMPLDEFSRVININLIGNFNLIRLFGHQASQSQPLDDNERAVIINVASIAAFEGQIGQAAYSASKGGIVGMTLPIARELARFGIRVVTIAPGLIETPMLGDTSDELKEALLSVTVYPKRLGQPDEFASLVEHVIKNRLLNGCIIRLDGAVRLP